jgi:hypothetical protein
MQALETPMRQVQDESQPEAKTETKKSKKSKKKVKAEVKISFEKYTEFKDKLKQMVLDHCDNKSLIKGWYNNDSDHENNGNNSDKPKSEGEKDDEKSKSEHNSDHASEHDEDNTGMDAMPIETEGTFDPDALIDDTPEQLLEKELNAKQEQVDHAKLKIASLNSIIEDDASKQAMMANIVDKYDPFIYELLEKNIVGSTKIETLYSKVKKSREKIDQILEDTRQYQKEFETIQVTKKSRPAKLKISRKVLESKLDSYKNYLMHLQTVIEGLERQIRTFRVKEKEYKKLAKIQGVGVAQKHNTQADILKKKITVLEQQIKKKMNEKNDPDAAKKSKKKSVVRNVLSKKRASVSRTKAPTNLAKEYKNAKSDLRDRDDQLKLLSDMLNSSAHQTKMKGKFIQL